MTDSATFTTPEAGDEDLGDLLLEVLPGDGSTMGNQSAREALSRAADRPISEEEYSAVKDRLVGLGLILKGQGRGGSVRLAEGIEGGSRYEAPSAPAARQQQVPQQWQLPAAHLRGQRRQRSLQRCSRVCVAPAEASEVSGCCAGRIAAVIGSANSSELTAMALLQHGLGRHL